MGKHRPVDECKLCGLVKELCDSHYVPKRLYAFVRAGKLKNPNPVMSVKGALKQISDQYRGYVFCHTCEDVLNKKGEKWVLANIPKDYDGVFPLHTVINRLTPKFCGDQYVLCNVEGAAGFEMKQLVYFGASIFLRGAVHDWKTSGGQLAPKVDLHGHEKPLKKFLLGTDPFPNDMVITLDIWPYKRVLQVTYPALANHLPDCPRYWFYVPGLLYALYFGENIPKGARSRSALDGFVAVDRKAADSVLDYTKEGIKSQYMGSRMEEMLQAIAKIRSEALTTRISRSPAIL